MVKNTSGGNKTKKLKRNFGRFNALEKIEQGQMFAKIIHNNGGSFSVICADGMIRLGKLTGEMKKGPRLTESSYVVISLREFESDQKHCDIIAHGNPPSETINILKNDLKSNSKNNQMSKADIEFVESDDEFNEFEESRKTIKKVSGNSSSLEVSQTQSQTQINTSDDYNWDDI